MASSSENSEDYRWAEIKHLALNCISDIHSSGTFATSGCFKNFVLPGISVDEVGVIRLPLSSQDVQSLIQASHPAPFGKGNQTLVDEAVRKTWEIDGSQVSFLNKAWHGWLDSVVRRVAEDLGVAGGPNYVRAELYKMLLYEEGAMFKPHKEYVALFPLHRTSLTSRSTEKTSNMFGTLIICLPSEHVGGAVHLTHGLKEKTFATDESSAFNITYTAW